MSNTRKIITLLFVLAMAMFVVGCQKAETPEVEVGSADVAEIAPADVPAEIPTLTPTAVAALPTQAAPATEVPTEVPTAAVPILVPTDAAPVEAQVVVETVVVERPASVADIYLLQSQLVEGSLVDEISTIPGAVAISSITQPDSGESRMAEFAPDAAMQMHLASSDTTPILVNGAKVVQDLLEKGQAVAIDGTVVTLEDLPVLMADALPTDWEPTNDAADECNWGLPYGSPPEWVDDSFSPTCGEITVPAETTIEVNWGYLPFEMYREMTDDASGETVLVGMIFDPIAFQLWNGTIDNTVLNLPSNLRYHSFYAIWTNKSDLVHIEVQYLYPDGKIGCYQVSENDNSEATFVEGWCQVWSAEMGMGALINMRLVNESNTAIGFNIGAGGKDTGFGIYPPMATMVDPFEAGWLPLNTEGVTPVVPTATPVPAYP